MAKWLKGRFGYPADDPFAVTLHPDKLEEPLHWKKPRLIFVCSMGDLFHESVLSQWMDSVFRTISNCPQHRFLLLTKRPERMRDFIHKARQRTWATDGMYNIEGVWFGISAENTDRVNQRAYSVIDIWRVKRFLSAEPMLGPIHCSWPNAFDWVICGGETGPGARPMNPDWARTLRDECFEAGIPFFFKQMSGSKKVPIPEDLMVRQVPKALERFFKPVPMRKEGE